METNKTPRGSVYLKVQVKLSICTKFHVNQMSYVEGRRVGGGGEGANRTLKCIRVTSFSDPQVFM